MKVIMVNMSQGLSVNVKCFLKLLLRIIKPVSKQNLKICSGSLSGGFGSLFKLHGCHPRPAGNPLPARSTLRNYSSLTHSTASSSSVELVTLNSDSKTCYIKWEDGFQTDFHSVWLRHNCHCEKCRHKNGQRLLDPASIPSSLYIDSIAVEDNSLFVSWSGSGENHMGYIPHSFLRAHNYSWESILSRRQAVKWGKPVTQIPTVTYEEITSSKNGILKWLQQLNEGGISLVTSVPTEESQVAKVAELVGPVASTIYGTTFDVKVTDDPINVAYSDVHIGLHMDLVYYESPPGLQLLHCLKFHSCVDGGESVFLDAFVLADEFRVNYPDLFHTLTTFPATFQKVHYDRDYPVHIVNQKPHIRLNHLNEIVAVYWAPPFEGPLSVAKEDVEKYYRAYEMFAKSISSSPHMLQHRLQPGDLLVFNNLRMLHGRNYFKLNGGIRHLKGCYVNIDVFKSMTQVLNNTIGDCRLAKRVGNQCWF